ncbi:N-formylglutamate amidohydrolase [Christiangramia salexigens]|uniref:N-formylglutamate amidohydrolase n=1 Tax=Christiangramia salexigens TaxID=1913577 RepID=A0A1L3J3A4_9FLAO|nr:N-formylglutamate amidohydrolase [Christiangramia salexigens]APG59592.1 N-formylglutamate amidohydrolase [Christiangramia salexigens]
MILLLTCEHATSRIPVAYRYLFSEESEILDTHEAYDPGTYDLYKILKPISKLSFHQNIGRLLVETNRSIGHPSLFSRYSKKLDVANKDQILNQYYYPFRNKVKSSIQKSLEAGEEVLHLSIHSFTPVLNGIERNCDVGLLYDPSRIKEKEFCKFLKKELHTASLALNIRFNYPYLGKADGFTTSLRRIFPTNYIGIEIEVNQKLVKNNIMDERLSSAFYVIADRLNKKSL